MKVRKYPSRLVIEAGKLQWHNELDLREISAGIFWGFERYQSLWFGIKIPFLTIEFSWNMYDEEKAPRYFLNMDNIPEEIKKWAAEMGKIK